jgi:hypothetical protein
MAASTADDEDQLTRQLAVVERLRLVDRIAHDLSATAESARPAFDGSRLADAVPGLLGGHDAQAWGSGGR